LQREILRLFFELPESSGFVLAGGAALIANGLSERPTQDVDLFSSDLAYGSASPPTPCTVDSWSPSAPAAPSTVGGWVRFHGK